MKGNNDWLLNKVLVLIHVLTWGPGEKEALTRTRVRRLSHIKRTQCELMIRRVQFIRRSKEAATQAACARNTRGYHSEYGNSWFNNRENDDAYYMFRSYNNCYYSSSEPVTGEQDNL